VFAWAPGPQPVLSTVASNIQPDRSVDLLRACGTLVLYSSPVFLDEPGNTPDTRSQTGSCFRMMTGSGPGQDILYPLRGR